jgi:hypothetical protein
MEQANLGQQIGYQLRGEHLNRMDLYVSQGIIAGNVESIAESAQIWRTTDRERYVSLVQQMERLGDRANARTVILTDAVEQQTQAVRDFQNRFSDVGMDLLDGLSQIQRQLASCESAIQNGFDRTIEAIENLHNEITKLLRAPQATRAHELVNLAKERLANAVANPQFARRDVAHAQDLINEALETSVGQTITQAWYLRGWIELNALNDPHKAVISFENARRVAQKNSEALIPFLYYCKAIRATGNISDQLVEECIKCLDIAALCPSLRDETSIELFSMIFESIQANQIPPEDMPWLRRRIDPKLEGILSRSPHLLPRLYTSADSESKNTLLRLYEKIRDEARSECQKMADSAESVLDFTTKLHRHSPADFSHEINAMNRLEQEACKVLPGKETEWKNSFRNVLDQTKGKLATRQTVLQDEISAIQRRIQTLEEQYQRECITFSIASNDIVPIFGQILLIASFVYGCWLKGFLFGIILPIIVLLLIGGLTVMIDSHMENDAKTKANTKYNRAIANMKQPEDIRLQIEEIERFRTRLSSIINKHF